MRFLLFLNFLFSVCFLSACMSRRSAEVIEALELAGRNRSELERVLDYYAACEADSLKLRAAEFLIANMPGHQCIYGPEVDSFFCEIDSLLDCEVSDSYPIVVGLNEIADRHAPLESVICNDIEVITADYLIHHIDRAFRLWESPWADYLTFDRFCAWLLPYKVAEFQPLDYWCDSLGCRFSERLRTAPQNDENSYSPYYRTLQILPEVRAGVGPNIPLNYAEYKGYRLFAAAAFYRMPFGDCFDYSTLSVAVLRSHGIPAVFDYLPQWGRGFLRHAWFGFMNDNGVFMASEWGLDSDPGTPFHPWRPIPKIYRYSYAPVPARSDYLRNSKYPLDGFSPFEEDVTDWYMSTSDPNVPLFRTDLSDDYLYIAAFNNYRWNPIDVGCRNGRKGAFSKMGRRNAYLVFGHDGSGLVPVSHPFTIDAGGRICCRNADTTCRERIRVTRKMLLNEHVARMEQRIVGARIEASDYPDFRIAEVLYSIDSVVFPDMIPVRASKKYRYWRLYSADGSHGSISELQFFMPGSDVPATGRPIGTHGLPPQRGLDKVFDGDWLTSYDHPDADGNWYGMAFDKPVVIDRVRCVPRTDDNLIHAGDTYELKYWDGIKWASLGCQVACERYLLFDNVPANALLWLSNLTRGYDERIFTYENDRQVWW